VRLSRKPRLRIVNFFVAMTDNILVIDGRRRVRTVSIRRGVGEMDRFHAKMWRRARHARTPPIRQ
jgi:hypothetical protein